MKIPKPRLRQVFEHSTHFKVVTPGGKSISIAKKPLSPGMLGRLRRYAQGGEVQKFEEGGEVLPADIERQPDVDAAMAATPVAQPIEEEAAVPSTGRRAVRATEATGVPQTAEQQAAADLERLRQEAARQAATPAPAPVTPPPVINVNVAAPTAPVAPAAPPPAVKSEAKKPAETPAPKAEAPAPAEEAAPAPAPAPVASRRPVPIIEERLAPAPVDVTPAPPVTIPSQDIVGPPAPVAPASAPMGEFLAQPGLLVPPLAAPTLAQVPVPAAPVSAPVAAVAPAGPLPLSPLQAPIPAAPEFKSVTVPEVRNEMKRLEATQPQASTPALIQTAVSNLTGGLTLPPLELQKIADLSAQEPEQVFNEAIRDQINAVQEQAKVSYQLATEEANLAAERQRAALAKATQQQIDLEALEAHGKDVYEDAKNNDDIKSFWAGQGFWRSLLGIASLVVSGYTSGYAGTKNFAYDAFENAVARDIEEQKRKRTMRWKNYEQILGDVDDAKKLYGADLKEVSAAELERVAKTSAVGAVGPKFNELVAKIRESAAKDRMSIAFKERGAEAREITAEAAKTRAEAARVAAARPRAAAAPKMPSTFPREKWETGRTFAVGKIPVKAPGTEGMAAVRDNLGARNYAVSALESAVKDLEALGPGESINILSQDRQKALASLALQIENFPQAFGYKRAVSLVAKQQLEKALANPTGIPAALKSVFSDVDIATGIKELRDEAVEARRRFVEANVDSTSQREMDAAAYGLWKLRSEEAASVGRKPPPMPKLSTPISQLESASSSAVVAPMLSPGLGVAPAAGAAPTGGGWRSVARPVK